MNGLDLTEGGGYEVYGSHDYVYAPGGQGVISYEGRDVLYYHYSKFPTVLCFSKVFCVFEDADEGGGF